jgi:hypothetical protein
MSDNNEVLLSTYHGEDNSKARVLAGVKEGKESILLEIDFSRIRMSPKDALAVGEALIAGAKQLLDSPATVD